MPPLTAFVAPTMSRRSAKPFMSRATVQYQTAPRNPYRSSARAVGLSTKYVGVGTYPFACAHWLTFV